MKFKIPSLFKNIYFIIIMLFIIWMLFFDSNSWLVHRELNKKVYKLENQKDFYIDGIKKDKEELSKMKTDSGLEEYAREKLFMKKEDEEIFIIEFDSIND
ncbi:MAG: septum formation initiator [Flavobacteriaceae bacterium]|nr:septum formation initiator [Flavobacteriaceae bacterium]MBK99511.1 septum formation initiator [Flavobacteriaceae bacterium]